MRILKHILMIALIFLMAFSTMTVAFAAVEDTGFSDVSADAWYTDAVMYCTENSLMSGTDETAFSPNESMTRAMLATVLYRMDGSPSVTGTDHFTDTEEDAWYSDGVLWASQNGIISGYNNDTFGTEDAVTREQIAAILWRYAGSPETDVKADFSDEEQISSWAKQAVDWAQSRGYMSGTTGNRFNPVGNATRAEVAAVLMRYQVGQNVSPSEPEMDVNTDTEQNVLVAYFSCTGNTEGVANRISSILDADLYEIIPQIPYTDEDLNYGDDSSRTSLEMNDPSARPAISGNIENMDEYDVVFIGYPIWWGEAPRIINTFLESYDFSGKTIIPFCTSGSSGIGSSAQEIQNSTENAVWMDGHRFGAGATESDVRSWIDGLEVDFVTLAND